MAVCADCQREAPTGALFCAFCGTGLHAPGAADAAEALVGASLAGAYFLHELIGRGGMADVYRATDLARDRSVVVKVLRRGAAADAGAVARFHREAKAAARLSHPNSVALLDSGETETGTLYMVMELVPGATLARLLATAGPLGAARAVSIGAQVLAALSEAHGLGIIHRDLKPANVMVDPRDGADRVKVLDFGIATVADGDVESRLTQQGTVFGTPAYMSPEQIRGEPLDARSDLYAVGVMLHEILAGRLPFEAETPLGLASRHLHDPPPPLSRAGVRVAPPLEALVLSALSKRPDGRPASAELFRDALLACPVEASMPPRDAALPPTVPLTTGELESAPRTTLPLPEPRRRRVYWAAGFVAACAAAALGLRSLVREPPHAAAAVDDRIAPDSPGVQPPPPVDPPPPPAPPDTATSASTAHAVAPPPKRADDPSRPRTAASGDAVVPPPDPDGTGPAEARTHAALPPAPPAAPRPGPPTTISAVRGELNSLPMPPAESGEGLLAVEASPWALLSVDGLELGESPREIQLGAGRHRVRAVHPDLGVREAQVSVKPGQRTVWVASFE